MFNKKKPLMHLALRVNIANISFPGFIVDSYKSILINLLRLLLQLPNLLVTPEATPK